MTDDKSYKLKARECVDHVTEWFETTGDMLNLGTFAHNLVPFCYKCDLEESALMAREKYQGLMRINKEHPELKVLEDKGLKEAMKVFGYYHDQLVNHWIREERKEEKYRKVQTEKIKIETLAQEKRDQGGLVKRTIMKKLTKPFRDIAAIGRIGRINY
jgi:hypothetical protein